MSREKAADDPAVAATPAAAPAPTTPVAGNNLEIARGELPRTGAGSLQLLVALAGSLLAAGVALPAAFGRRIRPDSSPGSVGA